MVRQPHSLSAAVSWGGDQDSSGFVRPNLSCSCHEEAMALPRSRAETTTCTSIPSSRASAVRTCSAEALAKSS
jgi:hypothetical protein